MVSKPWIKIQNFICIYEFMLDVDARKCDGQVSENADLIM